MWGTGVPNCHVIVHRVIWHSGVLWVTGVIYFCSKVWIWNVNELKGDWELGPYPADISADVTDE